MQIGNVAAAYFTAAIPIHTFSSLVLLKRQSTLLCTFMILVGWLTAVLVGASRFPTEHEFFHISFSPATAPLIGAQPLGPLYGISTLSCGIRGVYPLQQFFFHLLPVRLAIELQ